MLVSRMPPDRHKNLPFRKERPELAFCRAFEARHSDIIAFQTAWKEDAARYRATNATVLSKHFSKLEALITGHNADAKRISNADETGISAWKPVGRGGRKGYTTRSHKPLTCAASFQYVNRITMFAALHGNGDKCRPLFVFQGKKYRIRRYHHCSDPIHQYLESISDFLPRGA
ncbi:hypothetical protein BWQ96_08440 [Gracilariopsis chorda]|uniref:Uncharacterized protein n=1 Tax=Gracilariopsis chorda TaxID=448386 RepID=A0A2V3IIE4_9FLOR|nr:hypothetical protein BWQ96_08440 [Gracilariopsis chorda]|eukprot:PXF41841.1 hypothetical protein BWQ96_08440 [Gracilariopsis chorda]